MNLVTDPWIPIIRSDGNNALASLLDVFTRRDIADLNADPCERIALTRLLLAIGHRALDLANEHPVERVNLERLRESLARCVPGYLEHWRAVFSLGNAEGGFLRVPRVTAGKEPETPSAENLQFQRRTKNTNLAAADLALGLLTFQVCYVGGLGAGGLRWDSTIISTQNARSAECPPSMEGGPIYAFLIGQTLRDTISRNLLGTSQIQSQFGVPVWEHVPQSPEDSAAINNMTSTFLGRLLPISFSIVFTSGFERMSFGPVPYSYQNQVQDPWLAYVASKKDDAGSSVVRINAEKSLWRELPAITAMPEPGKRRGNLLLQQGRNLSGAQVWAGGLAKYQANVLALVESRFDLSDTVLERLRTEGYLRAFQGAESIAGRLRRAVKAFVNEASRPNPKGAVPRAGDAQMRYWNRLDGSKQLLFDLMSRGEDPSPWSTHCFQTARQVLIEVCSPTNAREFRALTLAQSQLRNP
jgi:CRISPR system Cascade subunit CasA